MLTPKSFIKANSQIEMQRYGSGNPKKLNRLESLKGMRRRLIKRYQKLP